MVMEFKNSLPLACTPQPGAEQNAGLYEYAVATGFVSTTIKSDLEKLKPLPQAINQRNP